MGALVLIAVVAVIIGFTYYFILSYRDRHTPRDRELKRQQQQQQRQEAQEAAGERDMTGVTDTVITKKAGTADASNTDVHAAGRDVGKVLNVRDARPKSLKSKTRVSQGQRPEGPGAGPPPPF